jgi:hypothetical protein
MRKIKTALIKMNLPSASLGKMIVTYTVPYVLRITHYVLFVGKLA